MGRRIAALALEAGDFEITDALEDSSSGLVGKALGDIVQGAGEALVISTEFTGDPDVLVDFSTPAGALARLAQCSGKECNVLIGTTGFTELQRQAIREASTQRAVLVASNTSTGVNVVFKLAELAAQALGADYDVEIVEAHHRHKKDAPSGTAMTLAERVARAKGLDARALRHGREGMVGERGQGEIGIHAVRGGDIVGDHTVLFATEGERIEIVHRAHTRDTFARGALRAARFLAGREPGMYAFSDVIGL